MLLRTDLMKKVSGVPIQQPEFILVDDYWYSFVLSYHLGADLVKI